MSNRIMTVLRQYRPYNLATLISTFYYYNCIFDRIYVNETGTVAFNFKMSDDGSLITYFLDNL